jgi:hypothetical protein
MLPYKYALLPSSNPSRFTPSDLYIRLVHLSNGELDGNLSCSMEPYKLSTAPKYEALSYCWGDPNDKAEITCDGRRLEIQGNLRDFLLRTRAKGTSRMLWIDAICVNQADDQEKSGQVMRMRDIYKSAARTLIWLGKEENDSTRGLDFAQRLSDTFSAEKQGQKISQPWYRLSDELSSTLNPAWVRRSSV